MNKDLFIEHAGDLYRKRDDKKIRHNWAWHFRRPNSARQLAACLRAGKYVWPGGYPIFFVTHDGDALCFDCVQKEFKRIVADYYGRPTGWRIEGCEVNWEDPSSFCAHCYRQIESAYGDKEAAQ